MSEATPTKPKKRPPPKPPRTRAASLESASTDETQAVKAKAANVIVSALGQVKTNSPVPLENGGVPSNGCPDDSNLHDDPSPSPVFASDRRSTSSARNSSTSETTTNKAGERDSFVVVDEDMSTRTSRPSSVFGDQLPNDVPVTDSTQDSTRRTPILPPPIIRKKSSVSSLEDIEEVSPKSPRRVPPSPPKKSRLPSHREEDEPVPDKPLPSPPGRRPLLPPTSASKGSKPITSPTKTSKTKQDLDAKSSPSLSSSRSLDDPLSQDISDESTSSLSAVKPLPSISSNSSPSSSPKPSPSTKKHNAPDSGSDSPKSSKPLLPPSNRRYPITRSFSADVPDPKVLSPQTHLGKPSPPNRHVSHDGHMVAPEDRHDSVINSSYRQESPEEDGGEEEIKVPVLQVINSQEIPVSPSSVTSDVTEVSGFQSGTSSPVDDKSRGTPTPEGNDETDGGGVVKSGAKEKGGKKVHSKRQPKVALKDDASWIRSKQETPPTSPLEPSTNPIPPAHSPYRSIPIRTAVDRTSSLSDKSDMSKPVVDSSGHYYPPANKPQGPNLAPGGISHSKSTDKMDTINENGDEVSPRSIPKRFKETRRSSSFSRPVSMMSTSSRRDSDLNASHTIPRGMVESLQEGTSESKKLTKQTKSESSSKKKGGILGLFRSQKTSVEEVESSKVEENISSSDDETGGTIKRMPKNPYSSLPRKRKSVAEPDSDDYVPEYHQLFEYVFVIGLKEDSGKKLTTEITYQFPPASGDISKDDALRSIHQFCYPDIDHWKPVATYRSESYSFVLTSIEGKRRFGYCRRLLPDGKGPRLPEVYCIISPLGCFDLYATILDMVEQRKAMSKATTFALLKSLIANRFPAPGRSVSVRVFPAKGGDMETIKLKRPPDSRLEHVDLAELYNTLGPKLLIQVISSILMERRVILAANRLSTLSSCCHALLALLYPFEWQHTFIPVLPSSLIDFCGSPLPFIIGINPSLVKQLDHLEIEMEEALVVDLDKRKLVKKFGDESSILPNKVFQYLSHMLDAAVIKTEYSKSADSRNQSQADQKLINMFMTIFAYFFGNYKDFLQPVNGEIQFQKEDFMHSFSSKSSRRFLDAFLRTQMFDKFIEEREDPVKAKSVTEGVFEQKLSELKERTPDIEIFSRKKHFPWNKKKGPLPVR